MARSSIVFRPPLHETKSILNIHIRSHIETLEVTALAEYQHRMMGILRGMWNVDSAHQDVWTA